MNAMTRRLKVVREFLLPDTAPDRSIPTMDRGLSPNDALDTFAGFVEDIDVECVGAWDQNHVLVGARDSVRLIAVETGRSTQTVPIPQTPRAVVRDGNGGCYIACDGAPIRHLQFGNAKLETTVVSQKVFDCPTSIAIQNDSIIVSQGSENRGPDEWVEDLMSLGASGSIWRIGLNNRIEEMLADDLAWPSGVVPASDESGTLLFVEAWRHRVVALSSDGVRTGLGDDLPGYPVDLAQDHDGGYLVTMIGVRTHLVEFVLREHEYRTQMMRDVDPRFWIAPSLRNVGDPWEPLQIGSMKHLGVTKPWAPARAYGLVAQLNSDGEATQSWHARVGSTRTGTVGAVVAGEMLVVASKGGRTVLSQKLSRKGSA